MNINMYELLGVFRFINRTTAVMDFIFLEGKIPNKNNFKYKLFLFDLTFLHINKRKNIVRIKRKNFVLKIK